MSATTTTIIAPFSTATFNSISTLQQSHESLEAHKAANPEVLQKLRALLLEHDLNDIFGFSLLHKHSPILPNEILVECRSVTSAWTVNPLDIQNINSKGYFEYINDEYNFKYGPGTVHPASWLVTQDNRLMPFEFSAEQAVGAEVTLRHTDINSAEFTPFVHAFMSLLKVTGLTTSLALTSIPRPFYIGHAFEKTVHQGYALSPASDADINAESENKRVEVSFFWPNNASGNVPLKTIGSDCEGWKQCKATVKDAQVGAKSSDCEGWEQSKATAGDAPIKAKSPGCEGQEQCKATVECSHKGRIVQDQNGDNDTSKSGI